MEDNIHEEVISKLRSKFKDFSRKVCIPPPVFVKMHGKVIQYNLDKGTMEISFPVDADDMNPFGTMQGGMIAAAIDNTLGPLSMLIAPLNFTRQLEVKYRKPIPSNMGQITVAAQFIKSDKRRLYFEASVLDDIKNELATAKAIHWIID